MNQVKVWIHENQVKKVWEQGFPDSYSLQPKDGFVEMTISSEDFVKWQMKERNPIQERSRNGKQILND